MSINFITDYPALYISEKRILVISDLHLGLEHELYNSGIVIHPQAEKFQKTIDKLIKLTKAKTLIILGDIKHEVPGLSYREIKEVPKLVQHLVEKVKVIIILGNHDTYIKNLLPKEVRIYSSKGFRIGNYGFFHGHAWPSEKLMHCDYLFMGHIHPAIEFHDNFGFRAIEQVWIKTKLDLEKIKQKYKIRKTGKLNTIILPAFNKLLGGFSLNIKPQEDYFGPLFLNRVINIEKSSAYLLDGTNLGEINQLKKL